MVTEGEGGKAAKAAGEEGGDPGRALGRDAAPFRDANSPPSSLLLPPLSCCFSRFSPLLFFSAPGLVIASQLLSSSVAYS
jgi:hypothetical protein